MIAQLSYTPNPQARALALRRNFLIGLVHDNPNAQMVLSAQQGILEALRGTEFELVVRPVDRGSVSMLDDIRHFLERQRLFGVILLPPISENDSLAELCASIGCRYVRMGSAMLDDARAHGHVERPRGGEGGGRASDRTGPPPHRLRRPGRTASARRANGAPGSKPRWPRPASPFPRSLSADGTIPVRLRA